jgi:DNA repair exonuclease SbcCD ATPase subunit
VIYFKTVRWKNLLSTGNVFTEVKLNQSSSTLIIGENGSGKSTFVEAISFALYGKPFRKINKPLLVNSINNKNLIVEIEFSIGKKEYFIRRGLKPAVFEILVDGVLLNQEAASKDYQEILEKNILRLTHKSFSQIITLGSSTFVPFMQLPAASRREFIEDLLDIQIFSTMNILLKDRVQKNKDDIAACATRVSLCEQKIQLNKRHIESMRQNNDEIIEIKQNKINEHNFMIEEVTISRDDSARKLGDYTPVVADQTKLISKLKKINSLQSELQYKITDCSKHIDFFEKHDECPTCTQDIEAGIKSYKLEEGRNKSKELTDAIVKLKEEQDKVDVRLKEIETAQDQIDLLYAEINDCNNKIAMYTRYNAELQKEITNLNVQQKKIETDATELNAAKAELVEIETEKEKLTNARTLLSTAALLLKDGGIKTKIIKQYVPVMNKLINKYLAAMDFFVQFELDENFDEKIKSRFRDEFTYGSFSEGEKMRIDLSLLFTWRAVSKLRNSASTNLLIMDEVFDSSLDTSGTEEFFKILSSVTADTNVFIISHKGDQLFDKFSSVIKFEKVKNFSQIANN